MKQTHTVWPNLPAKLIKIGQFYWNKINPALLFAAAAPPTPIIKGPAKPLKNQ